MHAPAKILPYVERFAREIISNQHLMSLQYLHPAAHDSPPEKSSIDAATRLREQFGGQVIGGWAIWERPKVYFEAEFIAVWQNPDGERFYIRRPGTSGQQLLFLPDQRQPLDGRFIDNHRRALTNDKQVAQYLKLSADRVTLLKKAGLKTANQVIAKTDPMRRIELDIRRLLATINERYGGWNA